MADFYIKAGDTLDAIEATIQDASGAAMNITGATTKFIMRRPNAEARKVDTTCEVVDAPTGRVKHNWTAAHTDTPGLYWAEFRATFPDGKVGTFPVGVGPKRYLVIDVQRSL